MENYQDWVEGEIKKLQIEVSHLLPLKQRVAELEFNVTGLQDQIKNLFESELADPAENSDQGKLNFVE